MKPAVLGWVAVFATVSAYDAWAIAGGQETLSAAYRATYRRHPWLVGLGTAYLVGHLTGHLPRRADILRSTTRESYV